MSNKKLAQKAKVELINSLPDAFVYHPEANNSFASKGRSNRQKKEKKSAFDRKEAFLERRVIDTSKKEAVESLERLLKLVEEFPKALLRA